MAKRKKERKKKKGLLWLWLLLGFFIIVIGGFFLMGGGITFQQTSMPSGTDNSNPTGTTYSGGSSGGSSGGTTNEEPTSDDYSWWSGISWPDFSFDMPCFWNCDDGSQDTTEETGVDTESDLSEFTFENCRFDSDCQNYCADPSDARCNNGDCSCAQSEPEPILSCLDTDKAQATRTTSVYEIQGSCYEDGIVDSRGLKDYCSRDNLVEYYCRTDTACATYTIDCKEELNNPDAFCYDGACTWLA